MSECAAPKLEPRCRYADRVQALCTGRLSDAEAAEVEEHLADCSTCSELVDALVEPSDAVVQSLAAMPPTADDEPEFQRMAALLLASTPAVGGDSTAFVPLRLADPPLGPLPQALGNYELLTCVGRGAWGAVYRARHTKLDQIVAVKVLDSSRLHSTHAVERFLQEMKAAGQLSHPNIARATDAGEDRGFHYLVMEYVDGVNVAQLLQQTGPLAIADACEIVRQTAAALDFAHRCAWVHRDVKPSNLMLTRDGTVKLLDLGVAGRHTGGACRDEGANGEPPRHSPLGTADYMAPEQWTNFSTVDARADVFSLGCTLSKLITGRPPSADHAISESRHALPTQPPSLAAGGVELPRGLDRFVGRMLAPCREDRVSTAAEVAKTLSRWSRRADLRALAARVCGQDSSNDGPGDLYAASDARPTRRRLLVGAAAIAGAAIAARWLFVRPAPRLRRDSWRELTPVDPTILLSVEPIERIGCDFDDAGRISVRSDDLALVHLGRAAAGVFTFQVLMRQEAWQGGAGLFFQGRRTEGDASIYQFQSLELRSADGVANSSSRRLVWSCWEVSNEANLLVTRRQPWAETAVVLGTGEQLLQITLGRSGFPEVHWNGRLLDEGQWRLSTDARRQLSLAPDQVQRKYLGRLGLLNLGGSTTFLHPRLAYL